MKRGPSKQVGTTAPSADRRPSRRTDALKHKKERSSGASGPLTVADLLEGTFALYLPCHPTNSRPQRFFRSHHPPTHFSSCSPPHSLLVLSADELTPVANRFWAPGRTAQAPFDPALIEALYYGELIECNVGAPRVVMLELSSYLENYLWRHFDPATASYAHVMSIIVLINEKFRENLLQIWSSLRAARDDATLAAFLQCVLTLRARFSAAAAAAAAGSSSASSEGAAAPLPPRNPTLRPMERAQYLLFATHAFSSLEDPVVRGAVLGSVSLPLWRALSAPAREEQLALFSELAPQWRKLSSAKHATKHVTETVFLPALLEDLAAVAALLGGNTPAAAAAATATAAMTDATEAEAAAEAAAEAEPSPLLLGYTKLRAATANDTAIASSSNSASAQAGEEKDGDGADAEDSEAAVSSAAAAAAVAAVASSRALARSLAVGSAGGRAGALVSAAAAAATALPVWAPAVATVERITFPVSSSSSSSSADGAKGGKGGKSGGGKTRTLVLSRAHDFYAARSPVAAAAHDAGVLTLALERGLELLLDLVSQLPTRRFVRPLLLDAHAVVVLRLCPFVRGTGAALAVALTPGQQQQLAASAGAGAGAGAVSAKGDADAGSGSDDDASSSSSGSDSDSSSSSSNDSDDNDNDDGNKGKSASKSKKSAASATATAAAKPARARRAARPPAHVSPSAFSPARHPSSPRLALRLLASLDFYLAFPVDDKSGAALSDAAADADCLARFHRLQAAAFRAFPAALEPLALATARDVLVPGREAALRDLLAALSDGDLAELARAVGVRPDFGLLHPLAASAGAFPARARRALLLAALVAHHAPRPRPSAVAAALPLYPTEAELWDAHLVPEEGYAGAAPLALPKLSLQFLTLFDYLWRNFHLYRQESAGQVRAELLTVVDRMLPTRLPPASHVQSNTSISSSSSSSNAGSSVNFAVALRAAAAYNNSAMSASNTDTNNNSGGGESNVSAARANARADAAAYSAALPATADAAPTVFTGRSPLALPLRGFRIAGVRKPALGAAVPESVRAEVTVDLAALPPPVRAEWEALGEHSVFFLLAVRAPAPEPVDEGGVAGNGDVAVLGAPSSAAGAVVAAASSAGASGGSRKRAHESSSSNASDATSAASADNVTDSSESAVAGRKTRPAPGNTNGAGAAASDKKGYGNNTNNNKGPRKGRKSNLPRGAPTSAAAAAALGIAYVRGCEVVTVLDEAGTQVGSRADDGRPRPAVGSLRTFVVALDPAQYQADSDRLAAGLPAAAAGAATAAAAVGGAGVLHALPATVGLPTGDGSAVAVAAAAAGLVPLAAGGAGPSGAAGEGECEDVYTTFNLLVRRRPEEGNFRAVLGSLQDLLREQQQQAAALAAGATATTVPRWLHDVFLGYGDPGAASYSALAQSSSDSEHKEPFAVKFADTFLSEEHLKDSFLTPVAYTHNASSPASASASDAQTAEGEVGRPVALSFPADVLSARPELSALAALLRRNLRKYSRASAWGGVPEAEWAAATGEPLCAANGEEDKGKDESKDASRGVISARPYAWIQARDTVPRRNTVRFTPTQVEAIKSGVQRGLTLIVGPPGTGKTDTAVQILSELFHNHPQQRILLVTHSNHALNDLFAKLAQRDVDERYLLRLGHGHTQLGLDKDYSKFGRVNHMLQRRLALLDTVGRLALALGAVADPAAAAAYTCETAGLFYAHHVLRRWRVFAAALAAAEKAAGGAALTAALAADAADDADADSAAAAAAAAGGALGGSAAATVAAGAAKLAEDAVVRACERPVSGSDLTAGTVGALLTGSAAHTLLTTEFPFAAFFPNLFFSAANSGDESGDKTAAAAANNDSYAAHKRAALSAFESLRLTFLHLEETRPFEILRSFRDRGDFLLSQHARVIALTCTHAAIRRREFLALGLRYDSIVVEEAAQVLDVETLIPLLLQRPDADLGNRLQRVVLLGDHHQLPPIVQNQAFQRYSRFDQSLFTRLVRLGVPAVQLNAQGRMRPELAALWAWRYPGLVSLPLALGDQRFALGNCGLAHETQLIDVGAESGAAEATPQPHFFQNLAEAEYVVHMYMYLRLMGHPASSISLLTTYNGQKALLNDVVAARCAAHPLYGAPAHIATVDEFQGQQNDFVLLSLVRTRAVGHIRDIRRLVVAVSRARLGLYVFAHAPLFRNCLEFAPVMRSWAAKPAQLQVCPQERNAYGWTQRPSWTHRAEPFKGIAQLPPRAPAGSTSASVSAEAASAPSTAAADKKAASGGRGGGRGGRGGRGGGRGGRGGRSNGRDAMPASLEEYEALIVANGDAVVAAMSKAQQQQQQQEQQEQESSSADSAAAGAAAKEGEAGSAMDDADNSGGSSSKSESKSESDKSDKSAANDSSASDVDVANPQVFTIAHVTHFASVVAAIEGIAMGEYAAHVAYFREQERAASEATARAQWEVQRRRSEEEELVREDAARERRTEMLMEEEPVDMQQR